MTTTYTKIIKRKLKAKAKSKATTGARFKSTLKSTPKSKAVGARGATKLSFPLIRELMELHAQAKLVRNLAQKVEPRRAQLAAADSLEEFVILPARGTRAVAATAQHDFLLELHDHPNFDLAKAASGPGVSAHPGLELAPTEGMIKVVDSMAENGAKLVEMTAADKLALKSLQPELRIIPVVYYESQAFELFGPSNSPPTGTASSSKRSIVIRVRERSGNPIAGVTVTAFTNLAQKTGMEGQTDLNGSVTLTVGKSTQTFELIIARREAGFWGSFQRNVTITSSMALTLEPINLSSIDCVRHFLRVSPAGAGANVTVGVVDTGVGPHTDLMVDEGENTVVGETPADFGSNGSSHGTHVAGIIASRGAAPSGRQGIAPGVKLHSYRVFGKNKKQASSFAIAKAIDAASLKDCHLINLSLGGGPPDLLVSDAIEDARDRGSLCIVAAGNDKRSNVSFPSTDPHAVAVSAMGRIGTFPSGALQVFTNLRPPMGTDSADFIAAFSNFGPEIDVAGPGVGVISTVIGGYGAMDGTSMACPAVTGALARRLSSRPEILSLAGAARTSAMLQLLLAAVKDLGFPTEFQGRGLPT